MTIGLMEPQRHIAHIRRKHIVFYVKNYVSMFLGGKKLFHGSFIPMVILFFISITSLYPAFSQPVAIGSEKFGQMIYNDSSGMEAYQISRWGKNKPS